MKEVVTSNAAETSAILEDLYISHQVLDSKTIAVRDEDYEEVCQVLYCIDSLIEDVA